MSRQLSVFGPFNHVRVQNSANPDDSYIIAPGDDYSKQPIEVKQFCEQYHTETVVTTFKNWVNKLQKIPDEFVIYNQNNEENKE